MRKEIISARQTICILVLFMLGSSVVMGVNAQSGQDSWISMIIATLFSLPVVLVYARIMHLFPGLDLYDIAMELFGKFIGKAVIVLFTWYALHLGALVLRNFSEFIQIVAMPETPQTPLMIAMILVTIYLAKSGIETLGKWAVMILMVVLSIVLFTIVASFRHMDYSYIQPIMEQSLGTLAVGAFRLLTFPLAETVLYLTLANSLRKNESPYKVYFYGIFFSAGVLVLVVLRNLLSLGAPMMEAEYFPSYTAARIINIGDFFTRIEGTVSVNFVLAGITKITVCILSAAKGFAKLFNIEEDKHILVPVGLLILALCVILYESAMEMFAFIDTYQYYAIPFQFVTPFIIWIAAEIKIRKKRQLVKKDAV